MHQTTQTWTDGTNTHILHTLYMYIHVLYTYTCTYMWRVVEALIDVVHVLANAVQWDVQHEL